MANDLLFQGGVLPTDPTRPLPGTDEPTWLITIHRWECPQGAIR